MIESIASIARNFKRHPDATIVRRARNVWSKAASVLVGREGGSATEILTEDRTSLTGFKQQKLEDAHG
jgi:hypothetical protein